jgi:excinuclease ABC subunit B
MDRLELAAMGQSDYHDAEPADLPRDREGKILGVDEIKALIPQTERDMKEAARALEFERAAELRDKLLKLREMELRWKNDPQDSSKTAS